ncbi:type II secretion system minor pseudopilin GspK [Kangiella sediminilitoris]|uniref:Type II secretion system protein K n=1 Tax=Kangiella sediminilitoris TaxID=1144748 RepID=A0A1B3B8C0_9GAMM|nr:type II secretion system minor pseudopilin GspK [Kangiella sediminilitoris]AOE49025.1 Type II secretion system protein K [Kangiella sediminilitoris]
MVSFQRNQGVALITVLVIFSVLSIMAIQILNSQQMQVQRTANIINGSRAYQYMYGAEVFATSQLKKFFEESKAERVHRLQPWSESGLAFEIEQGLGQLQGSIKDMHSCFNINSIIMEQQAAGDGGEEGREIGSGGNGLQPVSEGRVNDGSEGSGMPGVDIFAKLIESRLEDSSVSPQALAVATKDWIDEDQEPTGIDGAEDYTYTGMKIPYRTADSFMAHSSELLVIKGFTPEIYDQIKDLVCVLPTKEGTINVNTVEPENAELVWMLLQDVDLGQVRQALENLPDEGYDEAGFFEALGSGKVSKQGKGRLVFDSKYMLLTAEASVNTGKAVVSSLMLKQDSEFNVIARHIGE